MKINSVIKLGVALLVLIQTVQVAIAQVEITQIDQNLVSEVVVCDEDHRMDDCKHNHHQINCCQSQAVDMGHCHNSFQIGLALEPSKSLISALELSHLHGFSELSLFYPEPTSELFKPPI